MAHAPNSSPARDFADLGVPRQLCDVLAADGITTPFPIQCSTLPDSLAGRDVLGRGRTGSGKTLAFGLAVVSRLAADSRRPTPGRPRALVLAPTRELALQIDRVISPLAAALNMTTTTVFGGVGQGPQVNALRRGVDIVIGCPGRLEDLIEQRHCSLDRVQVSVLDEADHMADLGFLPGVKRLLDKMPTTTQHLLFSATLDKGVGVLVQRYMTDPVTHSVDSEQSPVTTMTHHVLYTNDADRLSVIIDLASAPGRTIIFTRTKHRAKQLTRSLNTNGVAAVEMHGNLSQSVRTRNLGAFADGSVAALVATDIAARGIHVDDIALVVHADPPIEHKAYLHRSGRTARAGNDGVVVTIALSAQRAEVLKLMRKAGISPTITTVDPTSPELREIAPGERRRSARPAPRTTPTEPRPTSSGRRTATNQGSSGRQGGRQASGKRSNSTSPDRNGDGARRRRRSSGRPARSGGAPAGRSTTR